MPKFTKARLYIYTDINEFTLVEFYKHWCPFSRLQLRLGEKLELPGDGIESMLYYTENREHFALSEQNMPCGKLTVPQAVSKIPDKMNFLNRGKDIAYVLGLYLHNQLCPFGNDISAKLTKNMDETILNTKTVLACFRVNVVRYSHGEETSYRYSR